MTYDMTPTPRYGPQLATAPEAVLLSPADFDQAVRELDSLRSAHRKELADQLRDARAFGSPGDDDDRLAVLDDAVVDRVKIARLERLIASATVIDAAVAGNGAAGLGSVVHVRDQAGREAAYELVGRRGRDPEPTQVTPASPVGEALLGARAGDVVRVTLPNGRERSLEVVAVGGR
jgi:transcription elongation factor GreA